MKIFSPLDLHGCKLKHLGWNLHKQRENTDQKSKQGKELISVTLFCPPIYQSDGYMMREAKHWGNTSADAHSAIMCCTWVMWWGSAKKHCPLSFFDFHRLPLLWREKIKIWKRQTSKLRELWEFYTQQVFQIFSHIFTLVHLQQLSSIKPALQV